MNLKTDFRAIKNCFFFLNYVILNSEKCHYMCIGKNCADDTFLHNGKKFRNSKEEIILGVIIDNKLSFDSHINRICKKAGQRLSAISWISAVIDSNKRQILLESMIKWQFSYCSRKSKNLINKIHERSIRIVTND